MTTRKQKPTVPEMLMPRQWSAERLRKIMRAWKSKRVLVVGDVGLDRYTIGSVERISPEAPVPIVRVEREEMKLGLAANVADNLRVLGGRPILVGTVGRDRAAAELEALLVRERISPRALVIDSSRKTVLKERVVSDRQQLLRIDYEDTHAPSKAAIAKLHATILRELKRCDAVILQDYAKGVVTRDLASFVFEAAGALGLAVYVDPNPQTPIEVYRGATLLKPNLKEAERLSGVKVVDDRTLREAGLRLMDLTASKIVVLTRGKDGMALFQAGNRDQVTLIPTLPREVYDVSGAGDTVISVLALAITAGADLRDAAVLANLAATVEVGKRGTATVTCEEILEMLVWAKTAKK